MSKARLKCVLVVPTQADGVTVKNAVTTDLAGKSIFATDLPLSVELDESGVWVVMCDLRFNLAVDCDDLFNKIQAKWNAGALKNKILAASRVNKHICSHELPWQQWTNCRDASYVEAVK